MAKHHIGESLDPMAGSNLDFASDTLTLAAGGSPTYTTARNGEEEAITEQVIGFQRSVSPVTTRPLAWVHRVQIKKALVDRGAPGRRIISLSYANATAEDLAQLLVDRDVRTTLADIIMGSHMDLVDAVLMALVPADSKRTIIRAGNLMLTDRGIYDNILRTMNGFAKNPVTAAKLAAFVTALVAKGFAKAGVIASTKTRFTFEERLAIFPSKDTILNGLMAQYIETVLDGIIADVAFTVSAKDQNIGVFGEKLATIFTDLARTLSECDTVEAWHEDALICIKQKVLNDPALMQTDPELANSKNVEELCANYTLVRAALSTTRATTRIQPFRLERAVQAFALAISKSRRFAELTMPQLKDLFSHTHIVNHQGARKAIVACLNMAGVEGTQVASYIKLSDNTYQVVPRRQIEATLNDVMDPLTKVLSSQAMLRSTAQLLDTTAEYISTSFGTMIGMDELMLEHYAASLADSVLFASTALPPEELALQFSGPLTEDMKPGSEDFNELLASSHIAFELPWNNINYEPVNPVHGARVLVTDPLEVLMIADGQINESMITPPNQCFPDTFRDAVLMGSPTAFTQRIDSTLKIDIKVDGMPSSIVMTAPEVLGWHVDQGMRVTYSPVNRWMMSLYLYTLERTLLTTKQYLSDERYEALEGRVATQIWAWLSKAGSAPAFASILHAAKIKMLSGMTATQRATLASEMSSHEVNYRLKTSTICSFLNRSGLLTYEQTLILHRHLTNKNLTNLALMEA